MMNKIKLTCLLFTTLVCKDVLGLSTRDSAPVIFLNRTDYLVFAKTDSTRGTENIFTCSADNADAVSWKYKASSSEQLADTLPAAFKTSRSSAGDRISITITDDVRAPERYKINGYYQCFATNTRGYTAISPMIRLVYVGLIGDQPHGAYEVQDFTGEQAIIGKPYRLPCFRDQTKNQGGYQLVPADASGVVYRWQVRDFSNQQTTIVNEDKRRRIDPKTGDLYFAYLNMADQMNKMNNREYSCWATPRDSSERQLNRLHLSVSVNPGQSTEQEVLYPTMRDHKVTCVEKTECKVVCIFGGMKAENGTLQVIEPPGSSADITPTLYGFYFKFATKENSGTWKCLLRELGTSANLSEVSIQVQVIALPKLRTRETFSDMFVTTNSTVEFVCDVENIVGTDKVEFYINGALVTPGNPSYVTYSDARPRHLRIANAQRNHSSSIMCVANNTAGSMYETVSLVVYDAPTKSQYPEVHLVESDNKTLYEFNCSFKLDKKAEASSVQLYWNSNRAELPRTNIKSYDTNGIFSVVTNQGDSTIESTLTLEFNVITVSKLRNTTWWCTVEYNLLGMKDFHVSTTPSKLEVKPPPPSTPHPPKPWPYTYVVVGGILGIIFLIALIVLMHVCVKKNKGEQYYVDEKERKAGHIPEQELEAYAFQDYKRPDQNPIKVSRASMNFSDKPMESDHGSMDEYGDIDTGRFNEDGSFIGQYAPNHSRNQANM